MNSLISIVIPAYNNEMFVGKTIESVIGQTYRNIEIIVIDDCSTDNTYNVVLEYAAKDERISVHKNEKNSGVSFTRNRGVALAAGEYIAFIDSDDIWREDKLQKQAELLEKHPDCPIVFTGSSFIDGKGTPFNYIMDVPESVDYRSLLKQNVISCSSVIVRRELMLRYPMNNDRMHEDFAVWLQILKNEGAARAVNEPLLCYRVTLGTRSSNKFKSVIMRYRVYRFVGLNIFQIMYYMHIYALRGMHKYRNIKGSRY